MDFPESRLRYLKDRLWLRARERSLANFADYYHFVRFNAKGETEWLALLDLVLNHETRFFRHGPSYDVLRRFVLPDLMRNKDKSRWDCGLSMWSAGCSNGAEAYSLAMAVAEFEAAADIPLTVLGTDISRSVLEQAERGAYSKRELAEMPSHCLDRYFEVALSDQDFEYQVAQALREQARFEELNLIDDDWSIVHPQDVIFCQNVLIYFDDETRSRVARRLFERLKIGGYLFLGPADAVGLEMPGAKPLCVDDAVLYSRSKPACWENGGVN